jgi:hypothetical protein
MGPDRAHWTSGTMARVIGVILVGLLMALPSVEALCRTTCRPAASTQPSCHHAVTTQTDASLAGAPCRHASSVAGVPTDLRRTQAAPTVIAALPASLAVPSAARAQGDLQARRAHRHPIPISPPPLVLRI